MNIDLALGIPNCARPATDPAIHYRSTSSADIPMTHAATRDSVQKISHTMFRNWGCRTDERFFMSCCSRDLSLLWHP
ncbi:hypothetical protein BDV38DRAFT_232093 [Aspergillus pseudotamarii]|uniref:Uncharacterized protein n=1 Tax=Aspergillus pseudotamarii TaxID=132259 RepID=A0A5N6TCG7_ASPPS|nr:uncharacterized protein BDV38DRAFT_232093 [Aspergillus pseudotamarii]KAE8143821.1 hypothetical protein BDV38DRAFT_232093 [Aspergillus pseudotamarii]